MSDSMFGSLLNMLDKNTVGEVAHALGQPQTSVARGMESSIAAMLGGLADLTRRDEDRGLWMFDDRWSGNFEIPWQFPPVVDDRIHPFVDDGLKDLARARLRRSARGRETQLGATRLAERFDARVGQFDARFAESRPLAIGLLVALLETLHQRLQRRGVAGRSDIAIMRSLVCRRYRRSTARPIVRPRCDASAHRCRHCASSSENVLDHIGVEALPRGAAPPPPRISRERSAEYCTSAASAP